MPQEEAKSQKIVQSVVTTLTELFSNHYKYTVDFYQREYVWEHKQLEDLITDLSSAFLENWAEEHVPKAVSTYNPYFMGEIVLSSQEDGIYSIIDGQQRLTSLTLLLIYILHTYANVQRLPVSSIRDVIWSDHLSDIGFNLEIDERKECMLALFDNGEYTVKEKDSISVRNIVERYNDIADCWNEKIDENNVVNFAYWILSKVTFSKVWTNSDDFAYVIFESMNDRGLALTQVEMLRSYLLANIKQQEDRNKSMEILDGVIGNLMKIKLSSSSKAEFEFFKMYFRTHYAEGLSQSKDSKSDFVQIGNGFHRWVQNKKRDLGLTTQAAFSDFISRIEYFAKVYARINTLIQERKTEEFLCLVVNNDYGFTLQPALILASIKYRDNDDTINEKIKVVSKYLTKVLSWRVWNHWMISQSSLEAPIYELCKRVRDMSLDELRAVLAEDPLNPPELNDPPTLNQQNRKKIKVLLALITEIVAAYSGEPDYMLNKKEVVEVEHIWANHPDQHEDEFENEGDFSKARDSIGDLLVLPKSFNASFGDKPYIEKVNPYFGQNILAKTLNKNQYQNSPGFLGFMTASGLLFKPYDKFTHLSINERAELYKSILRYWDKKENPHN